MNIKLLSYYILNSLSFYVERFSPKLSHYMSHLLKLLLNFPALKPGVATLLEGKSTEAILANVSPSPRCAAELLGDPALAPTLTLPDTA